MNHSFDIDHAQAYGLREAILIGNFQFWIGKNKANGRHIYDGHAWTYNSVKAFSELFPYMSAKQIRGAILHLIEAGVLITGNYNANASDRTLWYAFSDESIFLPGKMELPRRENAFALQGKSTNKTDSKPDVNADKSRAARATRLSADWMPSDVDASFLTATRPDLDLNTVADAFRDHWLSSPDGLKLDWSATWRNWVRREKATAKPQQFQPTARPAKFDPIAHVNRNRIR